MSVDKIPEFNTRIKNDSHTISYKVGRAILDAKSFKGVLQLPYKLYEARQVHLERQHEQKITNTLSSQGYRSVSDVYQVFGLKGLVYISQKQNKDKHELAKELILLSKDIKGDDRLFISLLALELDSSLAVLRGAAWSGVHCNNESIIEEVLNRLKNSSSFKEEQYQKTYKEFSSKIPKIKRQNEAKGNIKENRLKHLQEVKEFLSNRFSNLNIKSLLNNISKNELLFEKLIDYLYAMGGVKGVKKGIDQIFLNFNSRQKAFFVS